MSRFPNSEIPEQALFMVSSVLLHQPGVVFESVYPLCPCNFLNCTSLGFRKLAARSEQSITIQPISGKPFSTGKAHRSLSGLPLQKGTERGKLCTLQVNRDIDRLVSAAFDRRADPLFKCRVFLGIFGKTPFEIDSSSSDDTISQEGCLPFGKGSFFRRHFFGGWKLAALFSFSHTLSAESVHSFIPSLYLAGSFLLQSRFVSKEGDITNSLFLRAILAVYSSHYYAPYIANYM